MKFESLSQWLTLVANVGVIASLIFVGMEIRQNTIQAQAAAVQELGAGGQEWFLALDDRDNRLFTESNYPEAIERWTLSDWEAYTSLNTAALRWLETLILQVDMGLLPDHAMTLYGLNMDQHRALESAAFVCIWPELSGFVGATLRSKIDSGLSDFDTECPVDLPALRDQTILEEESEGGY